MFSISYYLPRLKLASRKITVDLETTIAYPLQLEAKMKNATDGLIPSFFKRLSLCSIEHISTICDYIIALRSEIRLSNNYRQNIFATLTALSRYSNPTNKGFKDFTRQDVIAFLDQSRKDRSKDPTGKWIGSYNAHLVNIVRFFKWLYFPNIEPTQRSRPEVLQNLRKLRRVGHISDYKSSDMWDAENHRIFLKYCPSPRDRCYHAIEIDIAARPHEVLGLKIKDIEFVNEEADGGRYARIVVNGKTGQRALVLIDSLPYVIQWISNHPQGSNREAVLLPNLRTGKAVQVNAMFIAYRRYKEFFTSLLSSENVPNDDKAKIRELLKKPWNPYVLRHSAITEKSGLLSSDSKLRQFAGWTVTSNMNRKYVHLSGGESTEELLRAKGIVKGDKRSIDILKPKQCPNPNCREPNKPDAQFCFKCNFIMSFEAHQKSIEEGEKKDREIHQLKEQMSKMQQDFESYNQMVDGALQEIKHEIAQKVWRYAKGTHRR